MSTVREASSRNLLAQALALQAHRNDADGARTNIFQVIKHEQHERNIQMLRRSRPSMHSFRERLQSKSSHNDAVRIRVGFKIQTVLHIDIVNLVFFVRFKLFAEWNDPYLLDADPKTVDWGDKGIFDPQLMIANAVELKVVDSRTRLTGPEAGLVKCTQQYQGTLSMSETSFGKFPFDFQDMRIQVRSRKYAGKNLKLIPWADCSVVEHHPKEEWLLQGLRTEVYLTHPDLSSTHKVYSALHICLMFQRDPSWYMRNCVITMSLIWAASWIILHYPWSTYDALGYRMETGVALVLACVATRFTVAEHLPKVSAVTLCESHMQNCFYGVMLHIFLSFAMYWLEKNMFGAFAKSQSDEERMRDRNLEGHFFGGQPVHEATKIMNHVFIFLTVVLFFVWHIVFFFRIRRAKASRQHWKQLADPHSVEMCTNPPRNHLEQFNGTHTMVSKVREEFIRKLRSLRRPVHSDGIEGDADDEKVAASKGDGKVASPGSQGTVHRPYVAVPVDSASKSNP